MRGLLEVGVENQRAPIRQQRYGAYIRLGQLEPVPLELHVAHDVGAQWPRAMGERRAAEAGMKFLGDGRAADLRAAFEHQRLKSGFGQVEGGD